MKKAISISVCILFIFIIFLPFGIIFSDCFGYSFALANYPLFAVITALAAMCTVVLSIKFKDRIENKTVAILPVLATPFALINTAFYMFECGTVSVAACMLICVCCCCYLTVKHGKPTALKIIGLVLSALMLLPVGFFGFTALMFGDFGENTVVQTAEAPNGEYYAQIINSDQGALGGDTFVDVYENREINAIVFKISKQSQRVYRGEWGEFEDMTIYWKNDHCLVINSVEYEIQ